MALDVETEDRLRGLLGIRGRLRDLHAAGLAAATHLHLCLDDGDTAELLGGRPHRLRGVRDDAGEYWHSVRFEEITGLVLEEIHSAVVLSMRGVWMGAGISISSYLDVKISGP